MALKNDWSVWDLKYGGYGQLGTGTTTTYCNTPVKIRFANNTTYTVTPSAATSGSISPASAVSVVAGKTTQFTVYAQYRLHKLSKRHLWRYTLSGNTYTTNAVSANCTVVAAITLVNYTVTQSVSGGNGTISPANANAIAWLVSLLFL